MHGRFSRWLIFSLQYGLVLALGMGFGWFLHNRIDAASTPTIIREPEGKYRFINPLIAFSVGEKDEFSEYSGLEHALETRIGARRQEKKLYSASVYFRDMKSGRWTGVNEEELYSPASLYKVALMIAVLKKAESEPKLLDEQLLFAGSTNLEKPDHAPVVAGTRYTVRELLERLIMLSDNDAKDLLRGRVGIEAVSAVFTDFRLSEPVLNETGDSMSARTYSRFFRTLYNATYLDRSSSEYALDLLSKVTFKSGIVNGLPPEARTLTVSHKFGYRVFEDPTDTVTEEIHDCGIVYVPERPYFVCIMTKGWNQTDLLDTIQALSRMVYEEAASSATSD